GVEILAARDHAVAIDLPPAILRHFGNLSRGEIDGVQLDAGGLGADHELEELAAVVAEEMDRIPPISVPAATRLFAHLPLAQIDMRRVPCCEPETFALVEPE